MTTGNFIHFREFYANRKENTVNTIKQGMSLLLALAMLLALGTTALAASASAPKTITVRAVEDHFTSKAHDEEWSFLYSDEYFAESGYEFRQDLASMTLGLAMASFTSRDAINEGDHQTENRNFVDLCRQIGFSDPQCNEDMKKPTTKESIGVNCAYRKRPDGSTLVALGIRGDVYRSEWGGNLLVGAEGPHQNWALCRDKALSFLKEYLAKEGITGRIKLWTTGYSRSGAVSNLVAGKLDDGYDLGNGATLAPEDLYCYTFECPRGAVTSEVQDKKYDNIHNVLNENDIITYVCPSQWGMARYGKDYLYPSKRTAGADYAALSEAAKEKLREIPDEVFDRYWPDSYKGLLGAPDNQRELYDRIMTALTTSFVTSRQDYADNVQMILSDAVNVWYSRLDKDVSLSDALKAFATRVQDNAGTVMAALVTGQGEAVLGQYLAESLRDENITTYDYAQMKQALHVLSERMGRMAKAYPVETVNLLLNFINIIAAHDVASNIIWIYTMPDGYLAAHSEYSWQ